MTPTFAGAYVPGTLVAGAYVVGTLIAGAYLRHPRCRHRPNTVTVQMHDGKQYFHFNHAVQSFIPLSA